MGGTLSQIGLLKLDFSVHLTMLELENAISTWRHTLDSKPMLNRADFSKMFLRPSAKKSRRYEEAQRVADMRKRLCR
jgi:hypothetical protein